MTWECAFWFAPNLTAREGARELRGRRNFSGSRQRIYGVRKGGIGIGTATKTPLCNNNDFHLRPMYIIFGMIERNVACCHACPHPYGTGAKRLAHLRISSSSGEESEVFGTGE